MILKTVFWQLMDRDTGIRIPHPTKFRQSPERAAARGRIHDLSDASGTDVDGRSLWVVVEQDDAECCRLRNPSSDQV